MPLSSHRDERGFIHVTLNGAWPSLAEVIGLRQSLGDLNEVRRILVDIRAVTGPLPKYLDIRDTVGSLDDASAGVRERKRAVIVSSDVQFGVARTFQALAPGQMEVFRDEPAAIAWLLADA
jgi:hypothetical protein